jgi:hypothetical protein
LIKIWSGDAVMLLLQSFDVVVVPVMLLLLSSVPVAEL